MSEQRTSTVSHPILRVWVARACIMVVFMWNVVCAVQFIVDPQSQLSAYQLSDASGIAAIRGMGVCFLMWNVTYPAFLVSPQRFRGLGIIVIIQQVVGLVGEIYILQCLDAGFAQLSASIMRFIAFDAAGLLLLTVAFFLSRKHN